MSTTKKSRSDSALKTLPEARQTDIAEYLAAHSLAETVAWLKADGLKTSAASLSEFLSWYSLRQQLQRNEQTVETLLAEYVKSDPNLPPEKIQAMGQAFFSAMSLTQQNPEVWVQVQKLNLQRAAMELDQRRVVLLEKKAAAYDRAQELLTKAKSSKGGITKETLQQIESELKLL